MQQLRLHSRPKGRLSQQHFLLETANPPQLETGLILHPRFFSVDPYMRTRMQPTGYGYIERWEAGSLMSGYAVAEVVESRLAGWKPGDWAVGHLPMQEIVSHDGKALRHAPAGAPPLAWLHPLGMTGFTAWLGMSLLGKPTSNDCVLVSAAAGAVGSIAAQLAHRTGARVIVSAGREDKRAWLRSLGFETVLDHRAPSFAKRLHEATPEGLTLNFENIGGTTFAAAIEAMRPRGRIILCGLISQYQERAPRHSPANLATLSERGVKLLPFVTPHFMSYFEDFLHDMTPLVEQGHLTWHLDIVKGGLAALPGALIGLLEGNNVGKRLVAL